MQIWCVIMHARHSLRFLWDESFTAESSACICLHPPATLWPTHDLGLWAFTVSLQPAWHSFSLMLLAGVNLCAAPLKLKPGWNTFFIKTSSRADPPGICSTFFFLRKKCIFQKWCLQISSSRSPQLVAFCCTITRISYRSDIWWISFSCLCITLKQSSRQA